MSALEDMLEKGIDITLVGSSNFAALDKMEPIEHAGLGKFFFLQKVLFELRFFFFKKNLSLCQKVQNVCDRNYFMCSFFLKTNIYNNNNNI